MTLCTCGGEMDPMADTDGSTVWQCRACGKPEIRPRQQPRGRVDRAGQVLDVVETAGEVVA